MNKIRLMNSDLEYHGIFEAKLIEDGDKVRVYIAGVSTLNPFSSDGKLVEDIFENNKREFPVAQWCCYNTNSKEFSNTDDASWVMFENGDKNKPVILSYVVIGGGTSTSTTNITVGTPTGNTVIVNWWHDKEVEYYIAGGGKGKVIIQSEVTTGGLMYMYRNDWNQSVRQYQLQQKYITEYSTANGLITIDGLPVVATIDFWQLGNAYVGRVIRVEFENGVKCDMIIGDVKGNIANATGVDYTVLNLGHLMGNSRNAINIIEYGCSSRLPSANEINAVTGSNGENTKSITLLDTDLLA